MTNSLPDRPRAYHSNIFDSPYMSQIEDRRKIRDDDYRGNVSSYGLSQLVQDRPNAIDEIKQYLIDNPGVDALTVARNLEVAPSHAEEVAKSMGISIEKGTLDI